ncbi:MAG TPA: sigma-70 family RNA polymerase sigma factor [Cyclobacteriaceae bacterium]|nr:sigma-70 family RNA polymerase sigma factor [Cyclobacteriaceae bacterium]
MTDCSDSALWSGLKKGDRNAFSMLYQRYVGLLYNYASRICKDRDRIQDCIQDVFVALWKYRKNLAATTSVKYYLYRALRSRIFKTSAASEWNVQDGVRWDDMENLIDLSPEEELMSIESGDERTRRLKKYLHNLSPRQYEAIMLRFYDEFSYEEIAQIMGANPQSVRNLVTRGLLQLRQYAQFLA